MTVIELSEITHTPLKVLSARTGKVMCHAFNKEKHAQLAGREVLSVWAELEITDSGFGNYCRPIMKVYAVDRVEVEA